MPYSTERQSSGIVKSNIGLTTITTLLTSIKTRIRRLITPRPNPTTTTTQLESPTVYRKQKRTMPQSQKNYGHLPPPDPRYQKPEKQVRFLLRPHKSPVKQPPHPYPRKEKGNNPFQEPKPRRPIPQPRPGPPYRPHETQRYLVHHSGPRTYQPRRPHQPPFRPQYHPETRPHYQPYEWRRTPHPDLSGILPTPLMEPPRRHNPFGMHYTTTMY